jgi:uncharacterized protein YbjT (DUF2867 family)
MALVVGATGLVGGELCRRLLQRGETVRALVRSTSAQEKVAALRSSGAECVLGDLKNRPSIAAACRGVDAVISTASSTLSRQAGDSIDSVDREGQLNLVSAAKEAGVRRFILVSFRHQAGTPFPLGEAKQQVEAAIADMNFTVIQASWFMEVWLSPALGFDYRNAAATIYGAGTRPISWVSYRDVAEMCAVALRHRAAERRSIEFGGPEAIAPKEIVRRFEAIFGRPFKVDYVPEEVLRSQYEGAADPMHKSFAALMLGYAGGDAMNMAPVVATYGLRLTTVDDYARAVLAQTTAA